MNSRAIPNEWARTETAYSIEVIEMAVRGDIVEVLLLLHGYIVPVPAETQVTTAVVLSPAFGSVVVIAALSLFGDGK